MFYTAPKTRPIELSLQMILLLLQPHGKVCECQSFEQPAASSLLIQADLHRYAVLRKGRGVCMHQMGACGHFGKEGQVTGFRALIRAAIPLFLDCVQIAILFSFYPQ